MPITNDDAERAVILILRDVTATIGAGQEELVRLTACHHRQFCEDYDSYFARVAEDVQQYFHDVYISTTWPTCPRHPKHPMWITSSIDGLYWSCERDGDAIARVGDLGSTEYS